ncbi:hypothetical protein DGWBC_1486 [Dehalogenimonas sp. WBC-2]|nr:hypothetical protein DGWBC_1486 [Dehalogenimonas sp. WBC-2]
MSSEVRPVIALVLARGGIEEFPEHSHLKYKALMPLAERPLAAYVIEALRLSAVERVFVLVEREMRLDQHITPDARIHLIDHDGPSASVAEGLAFGLTAILDYYGGCMDKTIMILPCDIPLATADEFNELIMKAQRSESDLLLTFIKERLIQADGRHHRTLYNPELKDQVASQNVNFINAARLKLASDGKLLVSGRDGRLIGGIDRAMDSMRRKRKGILLWPILIWQLFVWRMIKNGYTLQLIRAFYRLLSRKMTIEDVKKYFYMAYRVQFAVMESRFPSFSSDVDDAADVTEVLSKLAR